MADEQLTGREFRRTLEGMPPDMSDDQWDMYIMTGVEPKESSLDFMLQNVDSDDVESIASLQYTLKREGFDPGAIDGIMGEQTVAAMREAQTKRDMPITEKIINMLKGTY